MCTIECTWCQMLWDGSDIVVRWDEAARKEVDLDAVIREGTIGRRVNDKVV